MGKKYIVELEDKPFHKEDGDFLYRVKGFNSLVFDMTGIGMLTPYTGPDLEQVRKEAYEKGLSDAWDTVRKIRGMTWNEQKEVFGTDYFTDIIASPASECIEKIRQYEQEKDRQARIEYNFDEIKDVLETTAKECNVSLDEIAEVLQKMKE